MERLFRSRMGYVGGPRLEGCFLCDLAAGDAVEMPVLVRRGTAFLILNAFPYNSGHLMASPIRHCGELEDLTQQEMSDVMGLVVSAIRGLKEAFAPDGFNIGANLGEAAGAGLPGHAHMHIVPRWVGDTNFMSTVGGAKVLPESLEESYRRLLPLIH